MKADKEKVRKRERERERRKSDRLRQRKRVMGLADSTFFQISISIGK